MRLIVLPISGGRFPVQIAAVGKLSEFNYVPNLTLASSGGTVASYIACASKWNKYRIKKISKELNHTLFLRSWFSPGLDFIHSIMAGFFYGAVYRTSQTAINFFKKYFTALTITENEIWVGAVNYRTGAFCLFCNRSKFESEIKGEHFNANLCKAESLRYLAGDIKKITNSVMASSSVPIMVEPRIIDGQPYIDSGAKFASPLTPLQEEIVECNKNNPLHIIYVNGYDIEVDTTPGEIVDEFNIFNGSTSVTEHLLRGFMIQDRITAFNIIKNRRDTTLHYYETTIKNLEIVISRLENETSESLIEIYPKLCNSIDLVSFTGETVLEAINYAEENLGLRIWWHGASDIFSDFALDVTIPDINITKQLDESILISHMI